MLRVLTTVVFLLAELARVVASVELALALRHPPGALEALAARVEAIADPAAADYAQWLSHDELVARLAAAPEDVAAALEYLTDECGAVERHALAGQGDWLVARVPDRACALALARRGRAASRVADVVDGIVVQGAGVAAAGGAHGAPAARTRGAVAMGDPNSQKSAMSIPLDETGAADGNVQMVWGPGTFGVADDDLNAFYYAFNVSTSAAAVIERVGGGGAGVPGGDNFGEGTLDATYITSMGLGVRTLVANTNATNTTEETFGFGWALLDFARALAGGALPTVVSMSLGSLSYDSCSILCETLANETEFTQADCAAYMAQQRQVCMYDGRAQAARIDAEFLKITARGATLLGATGDGGSHFSFGAFPDADAIGAALNGISCRFQLPTYPASSPWVVGVGGTQWSGANASAAAPAYWYAGGSGFSWQFARRAWQDPAVGAYLDLATAAGALPPPGSFRADGAAYPDVAALASGVPMVIGGETVATGGTSASAPSFAGVVSLVNGRRLRAGLPALGFVLPRLYAAAAAAAPGELFTDIVGGNSSQGGDRYACDNGFVGAAGWDPLTGWGRATWPGLVKYFASDPMPLA